MRLANWLDEVRHDVTFAIRQLRRSLGFASVVTVTLALGIGTNSAMFALVDATLLRPLPFPDPDRLVMMWERTETSLRGRVSPLNLVDWNERNRTFDGMAGFIPNVGGMVMSSADGIPETVPRQWVSSGVFNVLGVKAVIGRTFFPRTTGSDATSLSSVNRSGKRASTQTRADRPRYPASTTVQGMRQVVVVPGASGRDETSVSLNARNFPHFCLRPYN